MFMRWMGIGLLFLLLMAGCKKTVEKTAENALMELITNGQWKVTSFKKGSNNITTDKNRSNQKTIRIIIRTIANP